MVVWVAAYLGTLVCGGNAAQNTCSRNVETIRSSQKCAVRIGPIIARPNQTPDQEDVSVSQSLPLKNRTVNPSSLLVTVNTDPRRYKKNGRPSACGPEISGLREKLIGHI